MTTELQELVDINAFQNFVMFTELMLSLRVFEQSRLQYSLWLLSLELCVPPAWKFEQTCGHDQLIYIHIWTSRSVGRSIVHHDRRVISAKCHWINNCISANEMWVC